MNILITLLGSVSLLLMGAGALASECVTMMSVNDPARGSADFTCKRVARNSNNGNVGFWRCCPKERS